MKVQDHYISTEDAKSYGNGEVFKRYYGTLVVNNSYIESPRFHEKSQAEEWLRIQIDAYQKA